MKGVFKRGKDCENCHSVKEKSEFTIIAKEKSFEINFGFNFDSEKVIYLLICENQNEGFARANFGYVLNNTNRI